MGPIVVAPPTISIARAHYLAALLLFFDFRIGELIHWLGGTSIHDHTPLDSICSAVATVQKLHPRSGYLVQDYNQILHIIEHGAPTVASYTCTCQDLLQRNL